MKMFIRKNRYNELVNDALNGKRASTACAETIKGYQHMLKTVTNERDFWRGKFQDVDFEFTNYKRDKEGIDITNKRTVKFEDMNDTIHEIMQNKCRKCNKKRQKYVHELCQWNNRRVL